MDCARIDLIAYCFGTSADDERDGAEKHLLGCTACLEAYLALKRGEEDRARSEKPRPEVRLRLRRDVERTFRPRGGPVAWLTRPIPLYQGLVAIGLAVLAAAVVPAFVHPAAPLHEGKRVDTSRPSAESLAIY
jgi:anti-sigma factor RsiW